jgi:hypothetical protein
MGMNEELSDNILLTKNGGLSRYGEYMLMDGLTDPKAPIPFFGIERKAELDAKMKASAARSDKAEYYIMRRIRRNLKKAAKATGRNLDRLLGD